MHRRDFLKMTGTAAGGFVFGGRALSSVAAPINKKPNILFFLTDDQRNDMLGCAGHPILQTPVIDSLAERGVRFENMFVTTSICAASRASIFTGVTERTHNHTFGKPPVPKSIAKLSYPMLLRDAGYRTGFVGKYGVRMRVDTDEMFDEYVPIGRNPYFHEMPDGSKRHETDLCADHAIEFLKTQPSDQPFCLSVSFNAPHAEDSDRRPGIGHFPWPPSVDGMYDDITMPPPRLSDPAIFDNHPEFLKQSLNRQRYHWRWDTPEKYQINMRAYFRMISGIDHAIGRVIETLRDKGLADNTVIIFSSDNGFYLGDRGFAGKWSHYEQSLRVPLVVYDPRLPEEKRNRVVSAKTLNVDIPAAMLDMAGVPVPDLYQGESFMPLVNGLVSDNGREDFFCEHLMNVPVIPKWEGVRTKRYVYARYFEQDPVYEFLHDLNVDPDQLKTFVDDPDYKDILVRLRKRTDILKAKYEAARDER